MTLAPFEQSKNLTKLNHIKHGFFSRIGQEKTNNFNCSLIIGNDKKQALLNRRIAAKSISQNKLKIASLTQTHSNKAIIITSNTNLHQRAEADALVTGAKNIALTILTADCVPILFADKKQNIIGAAHAGWKGAVSGIIENTILKMEELGANRNDIIATIGPSISGKNYEIGSERAFEIMKINASTEHFIYIPKGKIHEHFDLPNFVRFELAQRKINQIDFAGSCTYANEDLYFSHRYFTHHLGNEGRQISMICLN